MSIKKLEKNFLDLRMSKVHFLPVDVASFEVYKIFHIVLTFTYFKNLTKAVSPTDKDQFLEILGFQKF